MKRAVRGISLHPAEMARQVPSERAVKSNINATTVKYISSAVLEASNACGQNFNHNLFESTASAGLQDMEFKARSAHIGKVLYNLAGDTVSQRMQLLTTAMGPIDEIVDLESSGSAWSMSAFFYQPFSSAIELAGRQLADTYVPPQSAAAPTSRKRKRSTPQSVADDFDSVLDACFHLTQRFTAEYAVRPLFLLDQDRVLSTFATWTSHKSAHVRRFVSEGTRPRLPWGDHLPSVKENPSLTIPFLDVLKDDPFLYVRRSVANHLADILKDNPDEGLAVVQRWSDEARSMSGDQRKNLCWVIRHALRLPLKKGDKAAERLMKKLQADD